MHANIPRKRISLILMAVLFLMNSTKIVAQDITLNQQADGFRGVWYQREKLDSEYRYKYSGGLGTYCAKHQPFAVYCPEVNQTFFCYGGVKPGYHTTFDLDLDNLDPIAAKNAVYHLVSVYDHQTGTVRRPTILLDKRTLDAHDNPVLSVDDNGYLWVFSTSHGPLRPTHVHRSCRPYDTSAFELLEPYHVINGKQEKITNFSYMQVWRIPEQGFVYFFTVYSPRWERKTYFSHSPDGLEWKSWVQLADIGKGHYQVSGVHGQKAGTAFNYHPEASGLNSRTNLYYVETNDLGKTWQTADGTHLSLPLKTAANPALIHDFEADGLLVYMKDIVFDNAGNPIILFITSRGFASGPENGPRTWSIARWTGADWQLNNITTSDSNYDMGSLYAEPNGQLRLIAPTETGPQPYNPGGEVAMWISSDDGLNWTLQSLLTSNSEFNHTYIRRPVNANPDFYAFWADGHARQPSVSRLYFCNSDGDVFKLPEQMEKDVAKPEKIIMTEPDKVFMK